MHIDKTKDVRQDRSTGKAGEKACTKINCINKFFIA